MREKFEAWVLKNYGGQALKVMPEDANLTKELFYLINGLQYRIQIKDIPEEFV
jgi:hypothetical protein